jgi:hypothetical protein
VTPDGQEIVAPLPPEVTGHFGPGVVRFVLMQHVQGQVTVERLLAQLRGLGLRISKGQIVTILTANKDVFHAEKDAILEAGLATAAWVTVDDTGARHAGANEYTTVSVICSARCAEDRHARDCWDGFLSRGWIRQPERLCGRCVRPSSSTAAGGRVDGL